MWKYNFYTRNLYKFQFSTRFTICAALSVRIKPLHWSLSLLPPWVPKELHPYKELIQRLIICEIATCLTFWLLNFSFSISHIIFHFERIVFCRFVFLRNTAIKLMLVDKFSRFKFYCMSSSMIVELSPVRWIKIV